MNRFPKSRARGFSLLEVLIAVVIMSIGLLALAMLQLSMMRSSSEAKAQSVALALAKQQLESMRSFKTWPEYIALTDVPATPVSQGGVDYTLSAEVRRYSLDTDPDPDAYTLAPSDTASDATMASNNYIVGRDFKRVSVSVSWVDATGNWGATPTSTRTVTLEDVVEGLVPADSARVVKNTSSSKPRNIQVIITNPALTTGVIPIAISGSSSTAATNPKPELGGKDGDAVQETRFDILTYSALTGANTGKALAQARVETVIARCRCDTATKPTGTTARGYRPTYWNGIRYVPPALTTYVPPAGEEALSNQESQSSHCDICCRDHNDPAGITTPKFDPWRSAGHTHYGVTAGSLEAVGTNGRTKYLESCRMIRTDGILRVAADYRDEYYNFLQTVSDNSDTGFAPASSAITNYQNFVLAYLDLKVVNPNDSSTTPATSVYNNKVTGTPLSGIAGTYSINDPADISILRGGDDDKWLHGRGLYVDYLEKETLQAILAAKNRCVVNSCTTAAKRSAILTVLPFTSINVSELTTFSATSSPSYLSVTNDAFKFAALSWTTNPPKRGDVYTAGNPSNSGETGQVMTGTFNESNTGLTADPQPIDLDEVNSTDTQTFSIPAGSNPPTGAYTVTFSGYTMPSVNPPAVTPTTGSCSTTQSGQNWNPYSCNSTLTVPSIKLGSTSLPYNWSASTKAAGRVLDCVCTDAACGIGTHANFTTGNGDTALRMCKNFAVSTVTVTPVGAGTPTPPYNPSGTGKLETTTINFSPGLAAGANVTVGWTLESDTLAPGYTCTFTQFQGTSPKASTVNISDTGVCP